MADRRVAWSVDLLAVHWVVKRAERTEQKMAGHSAANSVAPTVER